MKQQQILSHRRFGSCQFAVQAFCLVHVMISTPIHVIDFEGSRQSGIVEYGVATLLGRSVQATYTRICAPVGTISDQDRATHGIHEEQARRAEPFDREWSLFAGLREGGPFAAHNVAVESGLITNVWPHPRKCVNFAMPELQAANWGPWLDTLRLYRRIYPGLESYGLEALVGSFGLQDELDARALYDALASALLLARLLGEPELAGPSLRWLMVQSAASDAERESMGQQELL